MSEGAIAALLIYSVLCGVIAGLIASRKNRSQNGFALLGLLLGLIGVAAAAIVSPGIPSAPEGMRLVMCPRCNAQQNVGVDEPSYECWQCKQVVKFETKKPSSR
jgi:uncharacterized membrane protein YeaQ/YmgE (transglycosylase-associated protein family)